MVHDDRLTVMQLPLLVALLVLVTVANAADNKFAPVVSATTNSSAILICATGGVWRFPVPASMGSSRELVIDAAGVGAAWYEGTDRDQLLWYLTPDCDIHDVPIGLRSIGVRSGTITITARERQPGEPAFIPVTITIGDVVLADGSEIGYLGSWNLEIGWPPPG